MKRGLLLAALALAAGLAGCAGTGRYGDDYYAYNRHYPSATRYYYYYDGRPYHRSYGDYYGPDYRGYTYEIPGPSPQDYGAFKDHG